MGIAGYQKSGTRTLVADVIKTSAGRTWDLAAEPFHKLTGTVTTVGTPAVSLEILALDNGTVGPLYDPTAYVAKVIAVGYFPADRTSVYIESGLAFCENNSDTLINQGTAFQIVAPKGDASLTTANCVIDMYPGATMFVQCYGVAGKTINWRLFVSIWKV